VGVALRRSLRTEVALMLAVLSVTAALVSYAPPVGATGPFSGSAVLGPARLELTVDPARVGSNQVHLYLFDRRTGRQWDRSRELTVAASLPDRQIGPLKLDAQQAGPGHYVIRRADLAPKGAWRLDVTSRASAFDEYAAHIKVPIR
jgi:copper transport protein